VTTVRIRDPLVGWQEIDEADQAGEHDLLADVFRPGGHKRGAERGTLARTFARGYVHAGFQQATPVSVPAGLTVLDTRVDLTCPGRSRVEAKRVGTAATPHRVLVGVKLRPTELPDFPAWWHENGHLPFMVPDLWDEANRRWQVITAARFDPLLTGPEDRTAAGRTITTTRDTNHHGPMPDLVRDRERQLLPGRDVIDRISSLVPRGRNRVTVDVVERRTVNLTIDGHDAHGVRLALSHGADEVLVWVVTANIGRHVPQAVARANIARVRRGFRP
jgi:hypothetical protein